MRKPRNMQDFVNRFESNVYPEPNTGCWLWGAGENGCGYGRLYNNKKPIAVHRFSLEHYTGVTLLSTDVVCHRCNNTFCVNPVHLYIGTQSDNMQQAQRDKRTGGFLKPQIPVIQYTLNGVFVAKFNSVSDIRRLLKYSQGTISQVCRGERIQAYGYKWKYITPDEVNNRLNQSK